ncbi:AraC family ligand binding domain-containing protein [Renibacterium salmoninarum]|uniref:AraC family ligand binding domain-containing protein n=1 Tax=Renibacterium salmoninarum TaxID=1646 RepID=UPI0018F4CA08|nr:AraC family ligand binding domain-containing protein [Renibacterium salmoninarum]
MSNSQTAIALEAFDLAAGDRFDEHVHEVAQLAWVREGVLMVSVADKHWMLPPSLALWIPAGVWHTTTSIRTGTMQGIYLEARGGLGDWHEPTVVSVSTLLRELIDHLCSDLNVGQRRRAEALIPDLLQPVKTLSIDLPMPADQRAKTWRRRCWRILRISVIWPLGGVRLARVVARFREFSTSRPEWALANGAPPCGSEQPWRT